MKIYKIVNDTTEKVIYVGSTTRTLLTRFEEHLKNNDKKAEYLHKNKCRIELIIECSYDDQKKYEDYYINLYKTLYEQNKRLEIKDTKNYIVQHRKINKIKNATKTAKNSINNQDSDCLTSDEAIKAIFDTI